MKNLSLSNKIFVNQSQVKNAGRGVYASVDIAKDNVIEICPFIEIPPNDLAGLNGSILLTYFFFYGENKEKLLLALGYGSIYNHSKKANAEYKINEKDSTITFSALKNIQKDEEITFNYLQGNNGELAPLWFEI